MIYSKTAKDLWIELEERYGQADGKLLLDLNNTSQGTSDVETYFTKL